jgi:flagellar basal-body rod protein FlgG
MLQALYTAANGMVSQQQNLDVIGNNVANINTQGFKKSRYDFKDTLYERVKSPVDNSVEKNLQRGTGAINYQIRQVFTQGNITDTARALDLTIEGDGFFAVARGEEATAYVRSGSFNLSVGEDGIATLVTETGYPVLDEEGEFIQFPEGTLESQITVTQDGMIYRRNPETDMDEPLQRLLTVDFLNKPGLSRTGDGFYWETENSGPAEPQAENDVWQGRIETSNVDYAEEVVRMIRAQRAYQFASRCIQTVDQMQQTLNNVRQ